MKMEIKKPKQKRPQELIFSDGPVVVEDKNRHGRTPTLAGMAREYNLRLALPEIILREVSKDTSAPQDRILERISKFFKNVLAHKGERED